MLYHKLNWGGHKRAEFLLGAAPPPPGSPLNRPCPPPLLSSHIFSACSPKASHYRGDTKLPGCPRSRRLIGASINARWSSGARAERCGRLSSKHL